MSCPRAERRIGTCQTLATGGRHGQGTFSGNGESKHRCAELGLLKRRNGV